MGLFSKKDRTEEAAQAGRELGEQVAQQVGVQYGKQFGRTQARTMDAVKGYNEEEMYVLEGEFFKTYMEKSNHPDRKKYRY